MMSVQGDFLVVMESLDIGAPLPLFFSDHHGKRLTEGDLVEVMDTGTVGIVYFEPVLNQYIFNFGGAGIAVLNTLLNVTERVQVIGNVQTDPNLIYRLWGFSNVPLVVDEHQRSIPIAV